MTGPILPVHAALVLSQHEGDHRCLPGPDGRSVVVLAEDPPCVPYALAVQVQALAHPLAWAMEHPYARAWQVADQYDASQEARA